MQLRHQCCASGSRLEDTLWQAFSQQSKQTDNQCNRARKDARPLNGTLTLRRTTANPNAPYAQSSGHPDSSSDFASYHNDVPVDTRYSKDSILKIYDNLPKVSDDDVKRLYVNGWNPEASNGSTGRGWGKGPDARDASNGPEVCWDQTGEVKPMSLEEMSEAEKAVRIYHLVV